MAVITALFQQNIIDYSDAFGADDITSIEMIESIKDCFELYFNTEENEYEDNCQRLPVNIVNKISKTMFAEYDAQYKAESKGFADSVLDELENVKKTAVQYMLMGGETLIKPVIEDDKITFSAIRRDRFIPLGRDSAGNIMSVGTAEFTTQDEMFFTLLEKRSVKGGKLTIENKLFRSHEYNTLGVNVPLSALEKYAGLDDVITLPIKNVGLITLKSPLLNDVDGSYDGVPIFEPAASLIHRINRNEKQFSDEFDLLQARIVVSDDMMKNVGENGEKTLVDKVFTSIDDDPENVGIVPFAPAIRDGSYINRKREYLRSIESLIGLKRGLLSDVQEVEKTATEITDSKGEYNLTIIDFQAQWTKAVKECAVLAGTLGQLYRVAGAEELDPTQISVDYGDGVLYNRDKAWGELLTMVQMGLLKPELALAWYFELPKDTEEDLARIKENYMPQLEAMMQGESGEE